MSVNDLKYERRTKRKEGKKEDGSGKEEKGRDKKERKKGRRSKETNEQFRTITQLALLQQQAQNQ